MLRLVFISAFAMIALLLPKDVFAQDVCAAAAADGDRAVREQYQHTIDYYLQLAAAARLKGFDPRQFPQLDNGQLVVVDLIDIVERLSAKRDEGIGNIYAAFTECRNQIAPYQRIIDVARDALFGGMQAVIPPAATHIDASRLLAGTPFGGPNALVPQTREWIFQRLGIGGNVADMIRNPLQVSGNGLFRQPWVPDILPGAPLPLPNGLPNLIPNLPPVPSIPSPPPIPLGSVGGHRVCLPWC